MGFPSRLKQLRISHKMTQQELGKKINVTKVSISGYEKGNRHPDLETIQKIADVFQVSVDFLLDREDEGRDDYPTWATSKDKRDARDFLEQQEVMFDGVPMSEEEKAKVIGFMEAMFWDAKKKNKRKQTE